jgi:ubiquinone/menaquinone biosynthesis C-methylase UbiE
MLERILEPEVMDPAEEARDYNAMDHAAVNVAFVENLLAEGMPGDSVLDLGTGTALIPIELCGRHDRCRITAVDAAAHMLEIARANVESAGLGSRIELQQVNARQLPWPDNAFDAVISNSIIHHIPRPVECLQEAIRVARPGGLLFFRDLLRPDSRAELERLVQTWAGNESDHARQMFADSLHAALSLEEMRALVRDFGFPVATVRQTTDRHWTWSARK